MDNPLTGDRFVLNVGHSYLGHVWVSLNHSTTEELITEAYSSTIMEQEKWYHVAVTWDKKEIKIFLNGTLETTVEAQVTPVALTNGGGFGLVNGSGWLEAGLQDLRLYPVVQSQDYWAAVHDNYCRAGFVSTFRDESVLLGS
jgi:hypothetical protein